MENRKSIKKQCIELDMEGYLFKEIADKLHISIVDVYNNVVGTNFTTRCDDEIIVTLSKQGLTCREIGPIIGKHYSTVARRLRSYKNKQIKQVCANTNDIPEEDLIMIKKLYLDGYCPEHIGKWYGIKGSAVIYRLKKCGIYKTTNSRLTKEDKDRIIKLRGKGLSYGQISNIIPRSRTTIRSVVKKYELELSKLEENNE